ncbi:hypothetical protein JQ604_29485 [Bradyrhizobium jicamae]|uniref:hypothetical protein n=1 Tax=Bradyrhizobium jicamae TaxID=280332 RepID=UPI001BA45A8E|nr:hypothetical protein [Bradyrhizobium jicamae]MBR0756330.1 hypothetical protein [Bradyrhizobium jicamae]
MRTPLMIAAGFVLVTSQPMHAAQSFDGLWAATKQDCRDKEGADSKTMIDLENVINGKPAPLVDQYENHCRVDRKIPAGDGLVLSTTCFEFWDDYKKNANGRKVTIKLAPGAGGTIKIDGKPYLLCKRKDQLPTAR